MDPIAHFKDLTSALASDVELLVAINIDTAPLAGEPVTT